MGTVIRKYFLFWIILCFALSYDLYSQSVATFIKQTNSSTYFNVASLSTAIPKIIVSRGGSLGGTELVCFDTNGVIVWSKQIGDNSAYFGVISLVSGTDGTSFVTARNINAGGDRICKLDSSGNVIWMRTAARSSTCDLTPLESGRMMHASGSRVVIYDSVGNIVKDKEIVGISSLDDIAVRDSSSALFVGHAYNPTLGGYDMYVAAISDTGEVLWNKVFTGPYWEEAKSVVRCSDGNFIVVGYTNSYGMGDRDIAVWKIDPNGNELWSNVYGTNSTEEANDIIELSNGSLLISGFSTEASAVERRLLLMISPNGYVQNCMIYSESSFPTNCRMSESVQVGNEIYCIGKSNSRAYLQKMGLSLTSGCLEEQLTINQVSVNYHTVAPVQTQLWHNSITTSIMIPIVGVTASYITNCFTTCPQLVTLNVNSNVLCYSDTLFANIGSINFDSVKFYQDNIFYGSNDSVVLANLAEGQHQIKAIRFYLGCVDSSVAFVQVDSIPQMNVSASARNLLLTASSVNNGVSSSFWIVNNEFVAYEDTSVIMLDTFGVLTVCRIGINSCGSDTSCVTLNNVDSVQFTYYHEMHASDGVGTGGQAVEPMHDGGAVYSGSFYQASTKPLYLNRLNEDGSSKWSRSYFHSTSYQNIYTSAVVEAPDNGVVVGGFVTPSTQISKGYIAKFDSSGNYKWLVSWSSSTTCRVYDVVGTEDSCFIAVGEYAGDVAVMKVNSLGDCVWFKVFDGYDYAKAVTVCSDGGIVVTGQTFMFDMFIMKLSSNGDWLWDHQYGGSGIDYGTDLVESPDGGFYILGTTDIFQNNQYTDIVLLKTDSLGQLQWTKRYWQYGRSSYSKSIVLLDDGNLLLYIKGNAGVAMGINLVPILCVNNTGGLLWDRNTHNTSYSLGYQDYDYLGEMELGPTNQLFLIGGNSNFNRAVYGQMGNDAYTGCNDGSEYILGDQSVNYNGAMLYSPQQINLQYSPIVSDYFISATRQAVDSVECVTSGCTPLVEIELNTIGDTLECIGISSHNATWSWYFGDGDSSSLQNPVHVYSLNGTYNVCAIVSTFCSTDTICQTVSVINTSSGEFQSEGITIFPNPSSSGFILQSSSISEYTVMIVDALGQVVITEQVCSNCAIDTGSLRSGIYVIGITDSEGRKIALKWIKTE